MIGLSDVGASWRECWRTIDTTSERNRAFYLKHLNQARENSLTKPTPMKIKTVNKEHVLHGLTQYFRSLSVIDDNQEITNIRNFPETVDLVIQKVED